eukprot:Phypoly_transcript_13509.p2 GENE.Phypoly_transcript_13509~~Phypoly_transcript_13509.p2  ORF type:complete len:112 (+),score=11.49 Phypoly_transcript_13509:531-866(+)
MSLKTVVWCEKLPLDRKISSSRIHAHTLCLQLFPSLESFGGTINFPSCMNLWVKIYGTNNSKHHKHNHYRDHYCHYFFDIFPPLLVPEAQFLGLSSSKTLKLGSTTALLQK